MLPFIQISTPWWCMDAEIEVPSNETQNKELRLQQTKKSLNSFCCLTAGVIKIYYTTELCMHCSMSCCKNSVFLMFAFPDHPFKLNGQEVWITQLVEHRSHDQKVQSSNPGRNSRRIFFSRVNFQSRFLFGVCSTPVSLQ